MECGTCPMKVVVVGLGLIGGSIAKSLKQNTGHCVLGMDTHEESLLDACSCGAIDGKAGMEDLKTADVVYLCVYPRAVLEFAEVYGPLLKEGCVLTDTCGVKTVVCQGIARLARGIRYTFVAGHPMAGKERSGFAFSDPSIFVGASYILVETGAPDWAVERVETLAATMGFGHIEHTTAQRHDQMIAFTSQVPHALACGYVMSPQCPGHKGFSAGSYRDVSRVANINDVLWSRLFLDNQEALVEELDLLRDNLTRIRDAVADGDEKQLQRLLRKAAEVKQQFG
ncbi:prephenate dehydrogenase [Acutalibacter intestini]|uniref:prephenate dehydrogenase n=1 Tax=Acutalibacter intestini TaxID=3093659 RepID=UPI002AC95606|nr:prephenate dehydrogenase [Acutalibacter sp. M00204]